MLARAVVDTDVMVAGICGPISSDAADLLDAHRVGAFEIVTSPILIAELTGVLARPAFERTVGDRRARSILDSLVPMLLVTEDIYDPPRATPDRNADLLVAVARAGGAQFVVSGDDSLASSFVRDLTIARPGEFVAALDVLAA